jgi:hypothetical protein
MRYDSKTYLTYITPDDDQDIARLFQPKANRAARRDADLQHRRVQRERVLQDTPAGFASRARTFLSNKGQ